MPLMPKRFARLQITILNASSIPDIDAAFAKLVEMRADALLVATDAFFFNRASQLVVLAARHAIPTLYSRREFTAVGGLMSYGPTATIVIACSVSTPPAY